MKKKKTWREKLLDKKDLPKVVELTGKLKDKFGEGTMVIPAPIEVDEIMKFIPFGKLITVNEIREILRIKHNTTTACPLTTGIFVWISANAAEDDRREGKKNITPYWRTLKSGGFLNPKYPGGDENHKVLLEMEGHKVLKKGKKFFVKDYKNSVVDIEEILTKLSL